MMNATNPTATVGGDGASLSIQSHSTKPVVEKKEIPVHSIQTEGTQTRAVGLNQETVCEYAESMSAGASFPTPVVFFDGTSYWLSDGFHRLAAAKQIGCNYIKCEVRPGGQRDALRWSLQANKAHGLKRTNDDKKFAVKLVLADAEWRSLSARQIADMVGVSDVFVGRVKKELDQAQVQTVCTSNPTPAPRCIGADGKSYPASKPQPPVSEAAEDPDFEYPADADEFDTAKLDARFSPKMVAAAKGPKSKNGKPLVCSLLIQKTLTNLSELCRQLNELGLWKKHDASVSAIIRDVRATGNMPPLIVKGPAPVEEPAPF